MAPKLTVPPLATAGGLTPFDLDSSQSKMTFLNPGSTPQVAAVLGGPVALWALLHAPPLLLHTLTEYCTFIALLGSMYAITGALGVSVQIVCHTRVRARLQLRWPWTASNPQTCF